MSFPTTDRCDTSCAVDIIGCTVFRRSVECYSHLTVTTSISTTLQDCVTAVQRTTLHSVEKMSVVVNAPPSLSGGPLHSPVRWRRRKSPSPLRATQSHQPHPQLLYQQQQQQQPQVQQQHRPRPQSLQINRRSDPGLLGVMLDNELSDAVVDSRWDVSRTAGMASCGLTRSMSLKNSFMRQREPIWLLSKCSTAFEQTCTVKTQE